MAESDRDEELDAQGLRHDFGLDTPLRRALVVSEEGTEEAILHGIRFQMHSPFRPIGPASDPSSVLLAHLSLVSVANPYGGGASHHLEAIAVEYEEEAGEWCTVAHAWAEKLDDFMHAAGATDPFERTIIEGRHYVIVMTPYCE